jgi:hypothetical protein
MRPFDESELPVVEPITLDDAVSEGLMLAKYSSRMRLKNRIIVGVLTHERRYDPEQYLGEAKRALGVLIDEFDLEAARIARQLRIAASMPGKAAHAHDYRFADTNNLQLREDTSDALTTALRERRSDESYLLELIESARQDAWDDIARAVEDWLDRTNIVVDSSYERGKGERMRLLTADLLALQSASSDPAPTA